MRFVQDILQTSSRGNGVLSKGFLKAEAKLVCNLSIMQRNCAEFIFQAKVVTAGQRLHSATGSSFPKTIIEDVRNESRLGIKCAEMHP